MKYVLFLLFFLTFNISFSKNLDCDLSRKILSNALKSHYDKKEITPLMIEQAVINYIDRSDPNKILLTKTEYDEILKDVKKNKKYYLSLFLTEKELNRKMKIGKAEMQDTQCIFLYQAFKAITKGQERYESVFKKIKEDSSYKEQKISFLDFKEVKKRFKDEKALLLKIENLFSQIKGTDYSLYIEKTFEDRMDVDYYAEVLNSILQILDRHTVYFSPQDSKEFMSFSQNSRIGFGFVFRTSPVKNLKEDGVEVLKILKNSVVSHSMIEAGDEIIEVNNKKVSELGSKAIIEEISNSAKKEELTHFKVKIFIDKENFPEEFELLDFLITPRPFDEEKIKSSIISKNNKTFLYIKLESFYENSGDDLKNEYFKRKIEEPYIDGIILDLRDNGGGSLSETLAMSKYFLGEREFLQIDSKKNKPQDYQMNYLNFSFLYAPQIPIITEKLIVLTNSHSASASEILSGLLKAYNRAIIVGDEHTYGKGSIQSILSLTSLDLGILKISTNVYFLANGKTPQFTGIFSDIVIPSETAFSETYEKDSKYVLKPTHKFKNKIQDDFKNVDKKTLIKLKQQSKKRVDLNQEFNVFKNKKATEKFLETNLNFNFRKKDVVLEETIDIMSDLVETKDDY